MLLLTLAAPDPTWSQTLASPDERVLSAILAGALAFGLAGLAMALRRRRSSAS